MSLTRVVDARRPSTLHAEWLRGGIYNVIWSPSPETGDFESVSSRRLCRSTMCLRSRRGWVACGSASMAYGTVRKGRRTSRPSPPPACERETLSGSPEPWEQPCTPGIESTEIPREGRTPTSSSWIPHRIMPARRGPQIAALRARSKSSFVCDQRVGRKLIPYYVGAESYNCSGGPLHGPARIGTAPF